MKATVALLTLVGFVQATKIQDVLRTEFESFKFGHSKIYKDRSEELKHLQIFKDNKELIEEHNKRFAAGEETYEMGVNEFTDLSPSEFERLLLTNITSDDLEEGIDNIYEPPARAALPSTVDWRNSGAVNPVKDQGQCGSCWAFSVVGAVESHHYLRKKQKVSLSEQNLVDCSRGAPYNNDGCGGGSPYTAYNYIKNNGIDTASYYPYQAKDNSCRYNKNYIGSKISGYRSIPSGSESALASAVANVGPISVCINAQYLQHYKQGVLNVPSCSKRITHAVVIVGYGTDKIGGDYWLTRNSWGRGWGENGYVRMARNRNNQCAIASYATYPLIL